MTLYDIIARQGSDLNLSITVRDSNSGIVDLTNYVASGRVKLKYSDTGYLLDLNPNIPTGTAVSGLININISGAVIATLPVTKAFYDIEIYNNYTGSETKAVQGGFYVQPGVTI